MNNGYQAVNTRQLTSRYTASVPSPCVRADTIVASCATWLPGAATPYGGSDKLSKMQKIADARGDPMSRFHNALYAGDLQGRISVLRDVGMRM